MSTPQTGALVGWLAKMERFVVRYGVETLIDAVADLAEGPWTSTRHADDADGPREPDDLDG